MAELRRFLGQEVLGHAHQKQQVEMLLRVGWGRFLFTGEEGIGKKKLASSFCRWLNCLDGGLPNCGCSNCKRFAMGSFQGFFKLDCEDAEQRKKLVVRELLDKSLSNFPGVKQKCMLLDNADVLLPQTEDLFLKDFEERQEVAYFLIARSRDGVRDTIASRLKEIQFFELGTEDFNSVVWSLPEVMGLGFELVEFMMSISGKSISRFRRYISGDVIEVYRLLDAVWKDRKKLKDLLQNIRQTKEVGSQRAKVKFLFDYVKVKLFERVLRDLRLKDSFHTFMQCKAEYDRLSEFVDKKSFYFLDMVLRYWLLEVFTIDESR